MCSVKLMSWNVNGIRAAIKKGFIDFMDEHQPDIIGLQETKAMPEQVELELPGYHMYWNSAEKKGYSGTAVFSKIEPLSVEYDMGIAEHDTEGRVISLEFGDYYLVNVYTPNVRADLCRLEYRQSWDEDFLAHCQALAEKKPVFICGDLNVAHQEIDLARPKQNVGNPGFTEEERAGFDRIVDGGFVDTFRLFHDDGGHYSWWSYRAGARERNVGWRIDYFCASEALTERIESAAIHPEVHGSDHCPVSITISSSSS